jgi:hypothetical protein
MYRKALRFIRWQPWSPLLQPVEIFGWAPDGIVHLHPLSGDIRVLSWQASSAAWLVYSLAMPYAVIIRTNWEMGVLNAEEALWRLVVLNRSCLPAEEILGEELKQIQIYTALDDIFGTLHQYSIELDAQLLGLKALSKENYFELANQSWIARRVSQSVSAGETSGWRETVSYQ